MVRMYLNQESEIPHNNQTHQFLKREHHPKVFAAENNEISSMEKVHSISKSAQIFDSIRKQTLSLPSTHQPSQIETYKRKLKSLLTSESYKRNIETIDEIITVKPANNLNTKIASDQLLRIESTTSNSEVMHSARGTIPTMKSKSTTLNALGKTFEFESLFRPVIELNNALNVEIETTTITSSGGEYWNSTDFIINSTANVGTTEYDTTSVEMSSIIPTEVVHMTSTQYERTSLETTEDTEAQITSTLKYYTDTTTTDSWNSTEITTESRILVTQNSGADQITTFEKTIQTDQSDENSIELLESKDDMDLMEYAADDAYVNEPTKSTDTYQFKDVNKAGETIPQLNHQIKDDRLTVEDENQMIEPLFRRKWNDILIEIKSSKSNTNDNNTILMEIPNHKYWYTSVLLISLGFFLHCFRRRHDR